MGSGKIEAMMVCRSMGYPRDENGYADYNDFGYGQCVSSDNSTDNFQTGFEDLRGMTNNNNFIRLIDLIVNKWIFVGTASFGYSQNVYTGINFYKVSSD